MTTKLFKNRIKFDREKVKEIRERISTVQGLVNSSELEKIVSFSDITCLPRRDAIIWFSIYSVAIASLYNEKDENGNPKIASYEALVAYLNKDKKVVDETYVFGGDIRYVISNKLYLFKLNDIFRKIFGLQDVKWNKWIKKVPYTSEERTILSKFLEPSAIIKEIAYWKYKTNYVIAVKYVYMIDRIGTTINKIYRKFKWGKPVRKPEVRFYEEIKPILIDLFDFYKELCPIDDRILPSIHVQTGTEKIPQFIQYYGSSKGILKKYFYKEQGNVFPKHLPDQVTVLDSPPIIVKDFYQFSTEERRLRRRFIGLQKEEFFDFETISNPFKIRELIVQIEARYKNEEKYLFFDVDMLHVLIDVIETFFDTFFDLYHEKMKAEQKISFFDRMFEETVKDLIIKPEIRELDGFSDMQKPILIENVFKRVVKAEYLGIQFINRTTIMEFDKIIKQMIEFSLTKLAEDKLNGIYRDKDDERLFRHFHSIYAN